LLLPCLIVAPVHVKDVAEKIAKQYGVVIHENDIQLPSGPVEELGEHVGVIRVGQQEANVKFTVSAR